MAVNSATSLVLSLVGSLLLISGMNLFRHWLSASPMHTIFGGFLGSYVFTFFLIALGNLGSIIGGKNYQAGLFEIGTALVGTVVCSSMIHRVCSTTSIIFSMVSLYYMHKLSQKTYVTAPVPVAAGGKKKRN